MALRLTYWIFILYLSFSMCVHGNGMEHQDHTHEHDHSSHMAHMEALNLGLFTINDIFVGKILPFAFPFESPSSLPHFLPREQADSIPFTLSQLPNLLKFFSIPQGSPQAKGMEGTLKICEAVPVEGETKFCATSLESMLDSARKRFGEGAEFRVLTSTHSTNSASLSPNYTILEVKEISSSKKMACHRLSYPYAVYYCHYQDSETKIFKISLGGEMGDKLEAVAVCHMDTSAWTPDHMSFRALGVKPGTSPVCHFFPGDHLVWIQSATTATI